MFVKCLGCGDAFGSGGRLQTSFYIRAGGKGILLDCGASTLIALRKEKLTPDDIDVILITHLHGDHFGGLPFILCEILALARRKKTLTIIGPPAIRERTLQALACFYPGIAPTAESPIVFKIYTAGVKMEFEGLQIEACEAIHSPDSHPHSLRLEADQKVVVFSGDTEWSENLIKISRGADLFICECSSYAGAMPGHLSLKQLLLHVDRIEAKQIVLTHLGEDALKNVLKFPLAVASDGMILMLD
ncbi:MAG: MBL fold metallo-hydrolase [Chryseosolibacter sp.]